MSVNVRLEEFGDIVGGIYECTLDPSLWPEVLTRLCETVGSASATIAIHNLLDLGHAFQVEVGTDPVYRDLFVREYVAIAPFVVAASYCDPGDVKSVGDVIDYVEFCDGRFYKEWAAPQGWHDLIIGILSKSATRMGYFGATMREPARDDQKRLIQAFMPHLERAVRISDLLEFKTVEAANLAGVVDGLASGVVLVDRDLGIRGINPSAEALLGQGRGLAVNAARLTLPKTEAGAALQSRIAASVERKPAEIDNTPVLLAAPAGDLGLVCHVLPLQRRLQPLHSDAVAAIFLTDPVAPSRPPMEALVKHFGLTPSETRVLIGLLGGHTPRAIADMHGIAIATIRTHLSRLFEKTGTSGQTELMTLLRSIRPVP